MNIGFLVLSIIGLALLPKLSVQLQPQRGGDQVFVRFSWYGMGAEVVEREVTSPIEGALSSLRGLQNISSSSYKGGGYISLEFKKGTDMDAARFEVSSILRSLHPRLPQGVPLPMVSYTSGADEDDPLLLIYTINGEGTAYSLREFAMNNIAPQISNLNDVSRVEVSGAQPLEWELVYDKETLNIYGLHVADLQTAIRKAMERKELGLSHTTKDGKTESIHVAFSPATTDSVRWEDIVVASSAGRIIKLTDIVHPRLKEVEPISYFRVNGLTTIYLRVYSVREVNQMALSKEINSLISELKLSFPQNFSMLVNYDASEYIGSEIQKIVSRALLAIIILLLFVLLISRRWRYLLIVSLSLLANICVGFVFYYLLGVEIHLISLASFTVSLGIIIDNTIIMADHIRNFGNRRAFMAILAATVTTIGAMTVVFFLKEEQRMQLIDFAIVIVINLCVSLAVALLLVPAMMDKLPLGKTVGSKFFRHRRITVRLSRVYSGFIKFGLNHRKLFIFLLVWAFGFPVFLLPDKVETKEQKEWSIYSAIEKPTSPWYISLYNKTLGSPSYVSGIKPWASRILGGSWYLFYSYFATQDFNWDNSRTVLYARGSMPDGSTIHQMNDVFLELENFLAGFEEIDMFISTIYGIDNSQIEITFRPEHETGIFPHRLKNELIRKVNQIGSADFQIHGVGQGFSNMMYENQGSNRLLLTGYNYDLLLKLADRFRDSLEVNPRVSNVIIGASSSWWAKPRYEFVMRLNRDRLEETGSSLRGLYSNLQFVTPGDVNAGYVSGKDGAMDVVLRDVNKGRTNVWTMENSLLMSNYAGMRLKDIGKMERERTGDQIRKNNQVYELNIHYEFIGPWELNRRVRERFIEQARNYLPLGFYLHDASNWGGWRQDEKSQYWLLFMVVAIVFLLCSILFESLRQPLAVLMVIPVSFIGLFLTFSLFKLNFDQGGYAAMLLLCALTINASIYIINEYNNMRKANRRLSSFRLYIKAFNHKIIPILLTIFSTILGLMPFLIGGKGEGFWFSLAAGATGGLIFSLLGVIIWLPLVFIRNKKS